MSPATGNRQPPTPLRLGILGGGRAAWAYGSTWRRLGWPIAGVWLREESRSRLPELLEAPRMAISDLDNLDADILLIAVSDRAVEEVAALIPDVDDGYAFGGLKPAAPLVRARGVVERRPSGRRPAPDNVTPDNVAPALSRRAIIMHASGALPSLRGGFSLHPLRALPPVGEPSDLAGALLVFEGNHRELARSIADAAGARFAEISAAAKTLYHASAVFGSNDVAALLDVAEELIGIDGAREDLANLAVSAVENWRAHRDARRFTGPAARGDVAVLQRHQEALASQPELETIYRLLAERIIASTK
jgi:predicted short-subunit dehydrogenase-like oxidoreductase (DUF2520 family)